MPEYATRRGGSRRRRKVFEYSAQERQAMRESALDERAKSIKSSLSKLPKNASGKQMAQALGGSSKKVETKKKK